MFDMESIGRRISELRKAKNMTQMELARKAIQKDGIKAISPIAPFLDRKVLSEYVKEKFL